MTACGGRLSGGNARASAAVPTAAQATPPQAPSTATTRPSSSAPPSSLASVAPSAARTASSDCRVVIRATTSIARLTEAISNSPAARPNTASSSGRIGPTAFSCRSIALVVRPVLVSGQSRARRSLTPASSARAWATDTSSRSRANTRSDRPPRSVARSASDKGTQASAFVCQNGAKRNAGGMTPTTRYVSPLMTTGRPTTDASPPKRRTHSRWASTTTRASAVTSASAMARPSSGAAPSTSNSVPETCSAGTRSVRPSAVRLAPQDCAAPIELNDRVARRMSAKSAGDTGPLTDRPCRIATRRSGCR